MMNKWTPVAAAVTLACAGVSALAQTTLEPVVVTATRIPTATSQVTQNAIVISAEAIAASGATNVNEAIRWGANVPGRIDTTGGTDQALDLRGFGATAEQNIVILVDGIRQNEGDSAGAALSWIPLQAIERIEVIRGNQSVLYGEGATAGVVNVVTKSTDLARGGSARVEIGSHRLRNTSFSLQSSEGEWSWLASAKHNRSDNHRDNYQAEDFSTLMQSTWSDGQITAKALVASQTSDAQMPGGLTLSEFNAGSTISHKTGDYRTGQSDKFALNAELPVGEWRLGVDTSRTVRTATSHYAGWSPTSNDTRSTQLGVKGWTEWMSGTHTLRFVAGVDSNQWDQLQDVNAIQQSSTSTYLRQEITTADDERGAFLGLRNTASKRDVLSDVAPAVDVNHRSWQAGVHQRVSGVRLSGQWGTSFRLPTSDEYSCYSAWGCMAPPNLKTQTSRDVELGADSQTAWGHWSLRWYQHRITNEIGYDSNAWANMNFDPTKRSGVEAEVSASLSRQWRTTLGLASRRAVFTSGDWSGARVPMVPEVSANWLVSYQIDAQQQLNANVIYVGRQHISDDYDNTASEQIPGYALLNLRYSKQVNTWTLSAAINNLLDKHYYNYRSRIDPTAQSIYPEAGRTINVSVQRSF